MPKQLHNLQLHEVSLVDRPANPGARIVLFKRDQDMASLEAVVESGPDGVWFLKFIDLVKDARSFSETLEAFEAREEAFGVIDKAFTLASVLAESVQSILDDPEATNKRSLIARSVKQFRSAVTDLIPNLEKAVTVRKAGSLADPSLILKHYLEANMPTPNEDRIGELENEIAENAAKIEEAEQARKAAEDKSERAEAVLQLSADARKHFDSLDEGGRTSFLKLDAKAQSVAVTKALEGDETLTVEGATIRKSEVGDAVFAVFKAQDAEIRKAREQSEVEIAKRELTESIAKAERDIPYLPGEPALKGRALLAINKMDGDVAKTLEAMLKSGDEAFRRLTHEVGHNQPSADSPEAQLDALAEAYAKEEGVSFQKAYSEILDSEAGSKLYAKARKASARTVE